MDVGSCGEVAGSAKRRMPEAAQDDSPPFKRAMAFIHDNTTLDSSEDDSFSYISDLLHYRDFYMSDKCDFSDTNFSVHAESTPVSPQPQSDLDGFLSRLTESEVQDMFSASENESVAVLGEMITSCSNGFNGDGEQSRSLLYSGPTITDVQSALSIYNRAEEQYAPAPAPVSLSDSASMFNPLDCAQAAHRPPRSQYWLPDSRIPVDANTFTPRSYHSFSSSINELFYRRLHRAKSESKYSVKVKSKCPGNGVDDGYRWRKYGQKAIKNSPYPRSYYRCTNPRCSAKKQVERCVEEPDTVAITYEGLHLHYSNSIPTATPISITPQYSNYYSLRHQRSNINEKKKAVTHSNHNTCFAEHDVTMQSSESPTVVAVHQQLQQQKDKGSESLRQMGFNGGENRNSLNAAGVVEVESRSRSRDGLLQDIVPLRIINPVYTSPASACSSSSSSSPS